MKRYIHLFVLSTAIVSVQSCKKMDNAAALPANAANATTAPGGNLVSTPHIVTTLAGNNTTLLTDGTGSQASFDVPKDVATDAAGNIFVADAFNRAIRKITPVGVVTTVVADSNSLDHGDPDPIERIDIPTGIAVDGAGNIYIADIELNQIRKFSADGFELAVYGEHRFLEQGGFSDGDRFTAKFNEPSGVAVDAAGTIYVADAGNQRIRKISNGIVTTFAGSGHAGNADGAGTVAEFSGPNGVAVDAAGNVYVADLSNNAIRKITPAGVVTTLAGGTRGSADGIGRAAQFNNPFHLTVDPSGNIYVADAGNRRIRKVTPAGVVTTFAGSTAGYADGLAASAKFGEPLGVAVSPSGDFYVADGNNNRIRQISRLRALPDPPVVK